MNLPLLQLGDSALPIGAYSHSWGLEAAVARGLVRDPVSLEEWTRHWLRHSLAPCEGVVVSAASRAVAQNEWQIVREANDLLWASLAPPTLRHASRDMGEQLLALAEHWPWAATHAAKLRALDSESGSAREWHHAVVFATLATAGGASGIDALRIYLHQAVLGVITAGVRVVPIGHTHGQIVLTRLHPEIDSLACRVADVDLNSAGSFCPAYEVLCHAQSELYTRLFRS